MIHRFQTVCITWLMLLTGMGFLACNDHDDLSGEQIINHPAFRIVITPKSPASGRDTKGPNGGESGDGTQEASENEYRVSNATLLFYQPEGNNGLNGTGDAVIKYAVYAPAFKYNDQGNVYLSDTIRVSEGFPAGEYHILAVCNMGDVSARCLGHKLSEVRDLTTGTAYQQAVNLEDAYDFVMTSSKEVTEKISGQTNVAVIDGTLRVNLFNIALDVERLAARIDISAGKSTYGNTLPDGVDEKYRDDFEKGYYQFDVTGSAGDKFYLMTVAPINLSRGEEYWFKRVASLNETTGEWTAVEYLGNEKATTSFMATNYVADPLSVKKLKEGRLPEGLEYANAYAQMYDETKQGPENYAAYRVHRTPADDELQNSNLFYKANNKSGDEVVYRKLAYVKENTLLAYSPYHTFATGLLFSGYYIKKGTTVPAAKTYEYFIRHADPNNVPGDAIMKYGIVRNNIYRICINGVASMGVIILEVRDWSPITVPDIEM